MSEGFRRQDAHLIQESLKFHLYYEQLEKRAHNTAATETAVRRLNEDSLQLTYGFRNFKRNVLVMTLQCKIFSNGGFNIPMQLDHIAREAEYFIGTLTKLNQGILEPIQDSIINENVFWLRSMLEHSRFITALLEQSEIKLVKQSRAFIDDFSILLAQAKDVESMLLGKAPTYPLIGQMLKDSENITMELRNFKKMGLEYLKSCHIQNVSSTMLLDHVVREAEHFLLLIQVLEQRLKVKQEWSSDADRLNCI